MQSRGEVLSLLQKMASDSAVLTLETFDTALVTPRQVVTDWCRDVANTVKQQIKLT